jgi:NitT/TauT family transport system permease protein
MTDDLLDTRDGRSTSEVTARSRTVRRRRWMWRLGGYAFFLGLWELVSALVVADYVLPSPQRIVLTIGDIARSGELLTHFGATLRTIAIGFAIAFVAGTVIAIAMGRSRWWEGFLGDWVTATMSTPGLVFALVAAIIFGLGPEGPIVAVAVTTYSFVAVNIVEGVRAVPNDLVAMSRSFGVSSIRMQRHVLIPFLAPYFFTALRYGFSTAWKIATLTEIVVGTKGIGFVMRREFQSFHMAGLLAWVILFFGFALFLEKVVLQRQINRFFRWRPEVAT